MARMQVRYVGTSTYRGLTGKEMADLGLRVTVPETAEFYRRAVAANSWAEREQRPLDPARDLVWGPHNQWTLDMNVDGPLESWLRAQDHFVLTAVNDEGDPSERVAEAGPEANHPGDTVVTHVDGQLDQKADTPREQGEAFVIPDNADGEQIPVSPEPTPETSTDAGSAGGSAVGGSTAGV